MAEKRESFSDTQIKRLKDFTSKHAIIHTRIYTAKFWIGMFLLCVILGSWLYQINTYEFDLPVSIAHLIAGLIVLSIADKELAFGWFSRLRRKKDDKDSAG